MYYHHNNMDPETKALTKVLSAYYHYEEYARKELLQPKTFKFASLTPQEQALIPWFQDHLQTLEVCIQQNSVFCKELALKVAEDWGVSSRPHEWASAGYQDFVKVKDVLKQLYREWSSEGTEERNVFFDRLFGYLETQHLNVSSRQHIKFLVPGAGLGRLNYELVSRGFWCQGNEFSYHMLLASNYVLNHSYTANCHQIFPFIHNSSNQVSRAFQARPVFIPDIHTSSELLQFQKAYPDVPVGELMSIASGSFTDLYGPQDLSISMHYSNETTAVQFRDENKESFDYIVTNFFIDTSTNIIEYLRAIEHSLKPDGHWINFGPLLWHFEDSDDVEEIIWPNGEKKLAPTKGLELTKEDLLELINNWFVVQESDQVENCYASDLKSLGHWRYTCQYWVATKK